MYDTIIIGAGPAGLAAGIYAIRREMKTLILTKNIGGQIMWSSLIENYPGFKSIPAPKLTEKMGNHLKSLGAEIKNAEVKEIKKLETGDFEISVENKKFAAKTVVVALGAVPRQLGVPGEKNLLGRGVAYCANCDGPLFKGKTVAVVGGGNSALDAAEVLSKIAAKIYLIHQFDEFQGFEKLVSEIRAKKNVEIILWSKVEEIIGADKVSMVKIRRTKNKIASKIAIDGIFIEIGFVPQTELVTKLARRNENKEIIINNKGETSLPGLFAAGDAANTAFKQITIAVGSGTIAALAAYRYVQLKKGNIGKLLK